MLVAAEHERRDGPRVQEDLYLAGMLIDQFPTLLDEELQAARRPPPRLSRVGWAATAWICANKSLSMDMTLCGWHLPPRAGRTMEVWEVVGCQVEGGSLRHARYCTQAARQRLPFFSQSCCWVQEFFWRSRLHRLRHRRIRHRSEERRVGEEGR